MPRYSKIIAFALVSTSLWACGQKAAIKPVGGSNLPVEPYGNTEKPQAEELLELETLAAPKRSVELRRRSEEREDDPFDLPPE